MFKWPCAMQLEKNTRAHESFYMLHSQEISDRANQSKVSASIFASAKAWWELKIESEPEDKK